MVPLAIHIKNFLSYGASLQTISFEEDHLICLSGNNGNGKSALLDAMTWSLWGYARRLHGVTKDDQSLMRSGERDMCVGFEFLVDKTRYLVRRSSMLKGKKTYPELVFGICDAQGLITKSLTQATQRETQEQINTVLGVDYDTFINSVFLRQGQSNEFSKKNPRERKEILSKILGIDELEEIRKRATEDVRVLNEQFKLHEQKAELLQKNLVSEQDLSTWHERLLTQREHYIKQKEQYLQLKEEEQNFQHEIELREAEIQKIKDHITQNSTQLHLLRERTETTIKQYRALKTWLTAIRSKYQLPIVPGQDYYAALCQKHDHINSCLKHIESVRERLQNRILALQAECHHEEALINEKIWTEKNAITILQENIIRLQKIADEYKKNAAKLATEHNRYNNPPAHTLYTTRSRDLLTATMHCMQKKLQQQGEERSKLYGLYESALQSKTLLYRQQTQQCPLCLRSLQGFNVEQAAHNLEQRMTFLQRLCNQREKRIQIITQHLQHIQHALSLHHTNEIAQKNCSELESTEQELANLETSLKNHTTARDTLNQQTLIIKQKHHTIFQEDETCKKYQIEVASHEYYQKARTALEKDLNNAQALAEQQRICPFTMRFDLRSLIQELRTKHQAEDERKRLHVLETLLSEIKKNKQNSMQIREELHEKLLTSHQAIAHDYAQYKGKEEQFNATKNELEHVQSRLVALREELTIKTNFTHILSKDGLQAALIEQIIPTLEMEANDLLFKLSGGTSHIRIESLRDLKSGKSKESLDIIIADEYGIRPYEFFSGGEAFRIDLSLRIALARTLAKRSGSVLQTLIIDEGFGSQDAGGIEAIVQALHKIKEDFQKIIVVSHLASFKEHFPTHFIVHKTTQGSTIRIFRQE